MGILKEKRTEKKKSSSVYLLEGECRNEKKKLPNPACNAPGILITTVIVALALQVLLVSAPFSSFASSYFPVPLYHRQERLEPPMKPGETVYLFHSGTPDVRRRIHVNDILTVYRINPSCKANEVGRMRVISFVGETYIKGDVLEGEIRADDVGKKGGVSCLVIIAGICDHKE
jgi:hypothetical protein